MGRRFEDQFHSSDGVFYESSSTNKKMLKVINRPIIMANDCNEIILELLRIRNTDPSTCLIKIGTDGGQGFFKVCLSVCDKDGKSQTEYGACAGGVKGLLILAIVPNISENHANVSAIFEELNIPFNNVFLCSDLKLANLICGIGSHSSTYPCCYCESSPKEHWKIAPLRTFGRIRELAAEKDAADTEGINSADSRLFKSVLHDPMIGCSNNTTVLQKVPPPELHLLMGTVNHIYKQIKLVSL